MSMIDKIFAKIQSKAKRLYEESSIKQKFDSTMKAVSDKLELDKPEDGQQDLSAMIKDHVECKWSESEIAIWLGTIPENDKRIVLRSLKGAEEGKANVLLVACRIREEYEAIKEKDKLSWHEQWTAMSAGWTFGGIVTGRKKL